MKIKRVYVVAVALLLGTWCYCQEIELNGSFNTSSEKRFQNGHGIGIQYQHDILPRIKIGVGIQDNFKNAVFDDIRHIDPEPIIPLIEKINSNSHRISLRLNLQGLLMNTERFSLSLGPEISYNYLWGKDEVDEFMVRTLNWIKSSENNGTVKTFGAGLISKAEVKNFISPKFSLCFTVRPEFTTSGFFARGGTPVFSDVIGFMEFQLGLKYRFKK
jgi:hypothetical protein